MWITDLAGNKALVDDGDAEAWTRLHGWAETDEPTGNQQVWMSHPDTASPGLIPWGARDYWQGIGWEPSAPPDPHNPTRDPSMNPGADRARAGYPGTGTVTDVNDWVSGDPARARAALEAEEARDNPRSTLIDSLQRVAAADDSNAATAAQSTEE